MDVKIHCDDNVCIDINISNLTKAEEIIHQVICLRRSMSPSVDLDFKNCILCLDIESSRRVLSRESILLTLLMSPDKKSFRQSYRITASGFRTKAAELQQAINEQRYLIESKTLELRYLTASAESRLPSALIPPLQTTNYASIDDVYSGSKGGSNGSNLKSPQLCSFILQKYEEFVHEVRDVLDKRRTSIEGPTGGAKVSLLKRAEDFLVGRNVNELLRMASEYELNQTPFVGIAAPHVGITQQIGSLDAMKLQNIGGECSSSSGGGLDQKVMSLKADNDSDSDSGSDEETESESESGSSSDEEEVSEHPTAEETQSSSVSVTTESVTKKTVEDTIVLEEDSAAEPQVIATTNGLIAAGAESDGSDDESDSDVDSDTDSSGGEEEGTVAVRLTAPTSMPIHNPEEFMSASDSTDSSENAASAPIDTVTKIIDDVDSSSGSDSDSVESEDDDTKEGVEKTEMMSTDAVTRSLSLATSSNDATMSLATNATIPGMPDVKGVDTRECSPPIDEYSQNIYDTQDGGNDNMKAYTQDVNNSSSDTDSSSESNSDSGGDSENEDGADVPVLAVSADSSVPVSSKSSENTKSEKAVGAEEKLPIEAKVLPVIHAGEDSPSSSSGEEEESDDDSSSEEEEEVKKPPLALLQLLYKKPTAKFPSCFLPTKQKRVSLGTTSIATTLKATAKKKGAKEREEDSGRYDDNQLTVTGLGLSSKLTAEIDDNRTISVPPTTGVAVAPIIEDAQAVINSKEEDEGDIETESDEEVMPNKILAVAQIPNNPVVPLVTAASLKMGALSTAPPTSITPMGKQFAPSAYVSTSEAVMAKVQEGRPIELPQPLFPTAQQQQQPVQKATIGTASNPAGSSSSECSSESTLTDESDSDESNLEIRPLSDRQVGQKSPRPLTSVEGRVDSRPPIPLAPNIMNVNQSLESKIVSSENDKNDYEGDSKKPKIDLITTKKEPQKNEIMKEELIFPLPPNFPSQQSISPSPSLIRKTPVNKSIPQIDIIASPVNLMSTESKVAKTEMKAAKEKKKPAAQRHSLGSLPVPPLKVASKLEDEALESTASLVGKVKNAAAPRKKKTVANLSLINSASLPMSPQPGPSAAKAKKTATKTATSAVEASGVSSLPAVAGLTQATVSVNPKPASKKRSVEDVAKVSSLSQDETAAKKNAFSKSKSPRKKA